MIYITIDDVIMNIWDDSLIGKTLGCDPRELGFKSPASL